MVSHLFEGRTQMVKKCKHYALDAKDQECDGKCGGGLNIGDDLGESGRQRY